MRRLLMIALILLIPASAAQAKVELPSVFSDNMVLQQQTAAAFWGKARPQSKIVITTTWSKSKTILVADDNGKWFTKISTPTAVRYGMKNWSKATLFNNFGIPASPFRSDNW